MVRKTFTFIDKILNHQSCVHGTLYTRGDSTLPHRRGDCFTAQPDHSELNELLDEIGRTIINDQL